MQKFYPSSNNNFDGTIIIQTVTGANNYPIQITLVDETGIVKRSFVAFDDITAGNYVPTCAAYNGRTNEYCIAGIVNNFFTTPDLGSWFLFLDADLDVISGYNCGLDLTGASILDMNMFVTDITSMEGVSSSGLGDFAYVGVGGSAGDPGPTTNTTTVQKRMCIGYASSSGMGNGITYDFTDPTYLLPAHLENDQYFPTRIIELPIGSNDGGFIVCGAGPEDQLNPNTPFPNPKRPTTFFLRTDYQFGATALNDLQLFSALNYNRVFYGSDLYFDPAQNEVWFAGVQNGSNDGEHCFIYQKLYDFGTPGLHIYPTLGSASINFGTMIPWDETGMLDVAKIMPTDDQDIGAIASNYFECSFYPSVSSFPSITFPMMNRINFNYVYLDNFTTYQPTDLYTYPRVLGNNGLGNFFPFLDYTQRHYPSHTAHQRELYGLGVSNYVLGATSVDPTNIPTGKDFPVLDMVTDAIPYMYNSCNMDIKELTPGITVLNLYPPSQILHTASVLTIDNLNLNIIDVPTVEYLECQGMSDFKNETESENSLTIVKLSHGFNLQSEIQNGHYFIYNMLGQEVANGNYDLGYNYLSMTNYPIGVYVIKFLDRNNRLIQTAKFINQ